MGSPKARLQSGVLIDAHYPDLLPIQAEFRPRVRAALAAGDGEPGFIMCFRLPADPPRSGGLLGDHFYETHLDQTLDLRGVKRRSPTLCPDIAKYPTKLNSLHQAIVSVVVVINSHR
jgi:hypothetical protein